MFDRTALTLTLRLSMISTFVGFAGLVADHAEAVPYTLFSGNSSISGDTQLQALISQWNVDGKQHLKEVSNWWRLGNGTDEASVHGLILQSHIVNSPSSLTAIYRDQANRFRIHVAVGVNGGAPGSGQSSMGETIRIYNTTASPLDFHFFEYLDLDLDETAGDDEGLVTSPTSMRQSDANTTFIGSHFVDRYEFNVFPNTLGKMTDGLPSSLNDAWPSGTGPHGPDDLTWTLQWNFDGSGSFPLIPVGGFAEIVKLNGLQMVVPEPSSIALAALGATAVLGLRRRNRR